MLTDDSQTIAAASSPLVFVALTYAASKLGSVVERSSTMIRGKAPVS